MGCTKPLTLVLRTANYRASLARGTWLLGWTIRPCEQDANCRQAALALSPGERDRRVTPQRCRLH